MKKAIAYLRVSTKDQSDRGYSLPTQEQDIRAYAAGAGLEIVRVFSEDESGQILDRPELTKAREVLRHREAAALIAHDSDRISRTPEHYATLRSEWEKLGVSLHYALRGEVKLGEFGSDVIEDIQGRFARQWLKKLIEATSRGKRGKVAQGNVIVAQRPPYGYILEKEQLIIDEAQAEIVRLIFRLYTQENYTIRGITDYLTKKQIPTPADTNEKMSKRRGYGVWTKSFVRNILGRETYTGVWHWGKTQREYVMVDGKRRVRITAAPRENWIPVPCPAIIDRETFEAAQVRLVYNKKMAGRNTKRQYLMAKRVICQCGRPCYADGKNINNKLFLYYFCASRHKNVVAPPCDNLYFRAEQVDDGAWRYIKNLLANPDRMITLIEAKLAEEEKINPSLPAELEQKREQLAAKEAALERLTRKWMHGGENEAVFDKLSAETNADIAQLKTEIRQLEARITDRPEREYLLKLAEMINAYEAVLLRDDEPFEVKLAWVEAFDLHAILWMDGEERKVTYRWDLEEFVLSIGTRLPRKYGHIWQIQETITLSISRL